MSISIANQIVSFTKHVRISIANQIILIMPKIKRASSSFTVSRAKKRKKLRIPERLQQDSDSDENDARQKLMKMMLGKKLMKMMLGRK